MKCRLNNECLSYAQQFSLLRSEEEFQKYSLMSRHALYALKQTFGSIWIAVFDSGFKLLPNLVHYAYEGNGFKAVGAFLKLSMPDQIWLRVETFDNSVINRILDFEFAIPRLYVSQSLDITKLIPLVSKLLEKVTHFYGNWILLSKIERNDIKFKYFGPTRVDRVWPKFFEVVQRFGVEVVELCPNTYVNSEYDGNILNDEYVNSSVRKLAIPLCLLGSKPRLSKSIPLHAMVEMVNEVQSKYGFLKEAELLDMDVDLTISLKDNAYSFSQITAIDIWDSLTKLGYHVSIVHGTQSPYELDTMTVHQRIGTSTVKIDLEITSLDTDATRELIYDTGLDGLMLGDDCDYYNSEEEYDESDVGY